MATVVPSGGPVPGQDVAQPLVKLDQIDLGHVPALEELGDLGSDDAIDLDVVATDVHRELAPKLVDQKAEELLLALHGFSVPSGREEPLLPTKLGTVKRSLLLRI